MLQRGKIYKDGKFYRYFNDNDRRAIYEYEKKLRVWQEDLQHNIQSNMPKVCFFFFNYFFETVILLITLIN